MEYQNYSTAEITDLFPQQTITYGSFWERFFAAIIDAVILIIPNYLLQTIIADFEGYVLSIALGWLYYAIMESGKKQATIGKQAMGLRVTDLGSHSITFGQASIRHFGKIVSTIILFFGYIMMIWDAKKQTLHDKMAGTLVVRNRTSW